ncbi:hypothetical protein PRUPE_1G363400 [Prunus persica]|uniref:Kinesin-like protein n=1 Tax=Prunus persica TaxID=3760 RepID=A0A251R8L8_PRUPE|nr:kinesin-like protein KIN-6 isoform X3 [Prunus persica]ONI32362.1 hypothetical protein PRUPE_1G363400 [Prunus persica]
MEINSPPPCPNTVTIRRNPHRRARPPPTPATAAPEMPSADVAKVRYFPTEEILSMDIAKADPVSENLRVFLRIRPLLHGGVGGDRNSKPRFKNVWPQNPAKRKSAIGRALQSKKNKDAEVCVRVNNPQSVTLSPPLALQESNRIKTEVYDGFSHVFSPDSSQEEVYEKMVRPLVDDFLRGKSGMLAALGPSGSGKTHTVFGCPRQPGMVPLALQHIFRQTRGSNSESMRSFFISIFEISSERGKGERLFDLSPNGGDLCMQQLTLKGLQEIAISDARQAESIIAQAMLKRATGMTNANSQSSRSQCIINIRGVADKSNGEGNDQASDGVLSIVDLAGAEREKRTGNQGVRLLESNFINNTSMVFGLCLRSLLEHQKNPKKPLQKHFQNSLLTKYLREYLEGKKRMALILTVKSGEEDYRDTSYVLRQASPYMEIKYNNVEEPSNISYNKRHVQALSRSERHKRMKVTGSDACLIDEGKSIEAENGLCEEGSLKSSGICKVDMSGCAPSKSGCADSGEGERNHQIMQSFAKALWNVLKQYKEKLKVADNEIQHLRESLVTESTRYIELKKELNDIKSSCACSHRKSVEVSVVELDMNFHERVPLQINVEETAYLREYTPTKDQNFISQVKGLDVCEVGASCLELENPNELDHQTCESLSGSGNSAEDLCESKCVRMEDSYSSANVAGLPGFMVNSSQSLHRKDSCSSVELDHMLSGEDEESPEDVVLTGQCNAVDLLDGECRLDTCSQALQSGESERRVSPGSSPSQRDCRAFDVEDEIEKPRELLNFTTTSPQEDLVSSKGCEMIDIPDSEPRVTTSATTAEKPKGCEVIDIPDSEPRVTKAEKSKECELIDIPDSDPRVTTTATKAEKPKRRLLPASSLLLRHFSTLDIEDDDEKPKGGKKKSGVEERKITQGSISLLRLLKSDLRI